MTVPLTLLAIFLGCIGISFIISGMLSCIGAIDWDPNENYIIKDNKIIPDDPLVNDQEEH